MVGSPHCGGSAVRLLMLAAAVFLMSGCGMLNRPSGDPRKDPSYLDGMAWKDQGRYDLARESFQRAADVNPANRYAHLELGLLYLERLKNPVVAIYHFERYMELGRRQEGDGFSEPFVQDRIRNSRIHLAMEYAREIGHQRSEVEVDQLRRQNAGLAQQVEELTRRVATQDQELQRYRGAGAGGAVGGAAAPGGQTVTPPQGGGTGGGPPTQPSGTPAASQGTPHPGRSTPSAPAYRTHTVRRGENPSSIARDYGVPLADLMAANPGLQPQRMQVGDAVRVPVR